MIKINMKKDNLILFILGIFSIFYFFTLKLFGSIAFSKFWIMFGTLLVILSISKENKSYIIKKNLFTKIISNVLSILFIIFICCETVIIYTGQMKDNECVDYVVVLGAGLKGRRLSQSLQKRMDIALKYLRENPKINVVVSGGKGPGEDISEAEAMEDFLIQNNINKERIIKEDKSRNTFENLKLTKEKLKEIEDKENIKILIITNNFHMFRAKMLAKRVGFEAYGISAPLHPYIKLNFYVREFFGVIKSYFLDK